jgi:hypothetical protein
MANLKRPVSDALEWVGSIRTEPNVNQAGRLFNRTRPNDLNVCALAINVSAFSNFLMCRDSETAVDSFWGCPPRA